MSIFKDIYPEWERLVKSAKEEVIIFSPYYNNVIIDLLANSTIPKSKITLVTDINPYYLVENPFQLETLYQLNQNGIIIKRIENLHAKILYVDGIECIIGSQNFTRRGREDNFEANLVNKDLEVLEEIKQEADRANIINTDLIKNLYDRFGRMRKIWAFNEERKKLITDIKRSIKKSYLEIQREELILKLKDNIFLKAKYQLKYHETSLWANGNDYYKLIHKRSHHKFRNRNRLIDKRYYPMINLDTCIIKLVRWNYGSISRVKNDVDRDCSPWQFWNMNKIIFEDNNVKLKITSIKFPNKFIHNSNIILNIRERYYSYEDLTKVYIFFDGYIFRINKIESDDIKDKRVINNIFYNSNGTVNNNLLFQTLTAFNVEEPLLRSSPSIKRIISSDYSIIEGVETPSGILLTIREGYSF